MCKFIGAKRSRTTPYHPASNGKIERWHRSLKTAIKYTLSDRWVDELPTILLGLRTSIIRDLKTSPSEMVYGQELRLPSDILDPPVNIADTDVFLSNLRKTILNVKPTQTPNHGSRRNLFIHPDLYSCDFVFLRIDRVKKPLERPYSGPYKVISRTDKYFTIAIRNTNKNVSIDRLKPAYILNDDAPIQNSTSSNNPSSHNRKIENPTETPTDVETLSKFTVNMSKTTRSGRESKLPVRFV